VLLEGSLPPTVHRIVKDEEYSGEIKIALTFTPAEVTFPLHSRHLCWDFMGG
jgi:hypothetical protein